MIESDFPDVFRKSLRLHLIGCGGTGVRALAEFGRDEGWILSGSDASPSPRAVERLARIGLQIPVGHAAENLPEHIDGVIHSPAVDSRNVERAAAAARRVPQASYPAVLGELSRRFPTIAITGTHGKSTVTAMVGEILAAAGRDRAVLCGAELLRRERHGWAGNGDWCVLEACEYRSHFLEMTPQMGVILGIEADHFDCFPTTAEAEVAYAAFVDRITAGGCLLTRSDLEATRRMTSHRAGLRAITLSEQPGIADWWVEGVLQSTDRLRFRAVYRGSPELEANLPILGRHHAINALAAIAATRELGIPSATIADALSGFLGLHRRLERLADWRGVLRYDDYAHHPTAVRAVLRALREIHRGSRIICVFQPHQLSRMQALHTEFASALGLADEIVVLPVYGAREQATTRLAAASEKLAASIPTASRSLFSPSLDHVRRSLETACRPGDLLVTLGAGDIDRLHHDLA